jgi:hypothetical protein
VLLERGMVGNSALLRTARPIHFGTEQTCRDRILMSVSRAKADVTALIEYFWLWTHLGSHSRLQVLPNRRRERPWLIDELDAGLALCASCDDMVFSFKGLERRRPSRG